MKYFFVILLLSLGIPGEARGGELLRPEISIRQPLDVNYASISEIQSGSVINNALTIRIPAQHDAERILVGLKFPDKESMRIFGGALVLRFSGGINSLFELPGNELILQEAPALLILHRRVINSSQDAYLSFDLVVRGISFAPPREVDFLISFSQAPIDGGSDFLSGLPLQVVKGSVSIPPLQEFEVIHGNRRPISFNSIADYTQGVTVDDYYFVNIKSNIPWILTVKPLDESFVPLTFPAAHAIPPSVIKFRSAGNAKFEPLCPGGTQLASKSSVSSFDERLPVAIRFDPGLAYRAGIYNLNFSFSLSSP